MIDTHCHLNDINAFPDPSTAIREAEDAGVTQMIVVGIDEEWSQRAVELADQYENVYATVGHHPNSAPSATSRSLDLYRGLWSHPKVVAIGEIGLDYHWNRATPDDQMRLLADQLDLAKELEAPVVFHCREAYNDLLTLLEGREPQPYLMHCWAGNAAEATRALALGCFLGVDGPITYKKNDDLRAVIQSAPLDRLVVETDAPWLPPEPYRGKPNHPRYLSIIAHRVGELHGLSPEKAETVLDANARRFFSRLP